MSSDAPMKRWLVDWQAEIAAERNPKINGRVCAAYARRADNETGKVNLRRRGQSPLALLAELAGVGRRTVSRTNEELKRLGFLDAHKRGSFTDYRLTFPSRQLGAMSSRHDDATHRATTTRSSRHNGAHVSSFPAQESAAPLVGPPAAAAGLHDDDNASPVDVFDERHARFRRRSPWRADEAQKILLRLDAPRDGDRWSEFVEAAQWYGTMTSSRFYPDAMQLEVITTRVEVKRASKRPPRLYVVEERWRRPNPRAIFDEQHRESLIRPPLSEAEAERVLREIGHPGPPPLASWQDLVECARHCGPDERLIDARLLAVMESLEATPPSPPRGQDEDDDDEGQGEAA